jgi:hypothetical protein
MKYILMSAVAALALIPVAAQAQEPASATASAQVSAGDTIYGSDGQSIGTVADAREDAILIDTGTHKIPVPADALGASDKGPTLNITKDELNEQYAQQLAQAAARLEAVLVAGAQIATADAQPLGTVKSVEGDNVVLESEVGPLTLPREYFAIDQSGSPIVRATLSQIQEAISAASTGG